MKMPRKISARMMPTMSTSCCIFFGTANRAMMMTNTKRLSIERLYSVSQPTRNCPANSAAEKKHEPGEDQRERDVEDDPEGRLLERRHVRPLQDEEEVGDEDQGQDDERSDSNQMGSSSTGSLSEIRGRRRSESLSPRRRGPHDRSAGDGARIDDRGSRRASRDTPLRFRESSRIRRECGERVDEGEPTDVARASTPERRMPSQKRGHSGVVVNHMSDPSGI